MFASTSRMLRKAAQRRQFSTMFENTNQINATRSKFYTNPAVGAENPTYLKHGMSDKILFGVAIGGGSLGLVLILKGLWNMTWGINKVPVN